MSEIIRLAAEQCTDDIGWPTAAVFIALFVAGALVFWAVTR